MGHRWRSLPLWIVSTDRLRKAGWLVCAKLVDARNAFLCMPRMFANAYVPAVDKAQAQYWLRSKRCRKLNTYDPISGARVSLAQSLYVDDLAAKAIGNNIPELKEE